MADEPQSIVELLDRIRTAGEDEEQVSLDDMLDELGRRSFGPVLTFAGLAVLAPVVGDIPGVPTMIGLLVALTVGQVVLEADHIWLPGFILNRSVERAKVEKAVSWLRKPGEWVDRVTRPRLAAVVQGTGGRIFVGGVALFVALMLPGMEIVPFSANGGGLALALLGVSLLTEDGALAVIATVVVLGTLALGVWSLA